MPRYLYLITAILVPVLLAVFLGRVLAVVPFLPVALVTGALAAFITFHNPESGLIILVFSMLLSPEIKLASIPGRDVVVRIDDILLIVVFLAWLAYLATTKDWKGFVKTPLDGPILLLLLVFFASTAHGILLGTLNPLKAFFYVVKYFEYFILYWMASNIIARNRNVSKYLTAGLLTCLAVALFAYYLMQFDIRVYAPFDTSATGVMNVGESASLAGYLLIVMLTALGLLVTGERRRDWWLLALAGFLLLPFVRTLSRASFLALPPALLMLLWFAPRRKASLVSVLILGILIFPVIGSKHYQLAVDRMKYTFSERDARYAVGSLGVSVEGSAAARLESWKSSVTQWLPRRPLLGHGITGVGLVDAQLPLFLGEIGILGVLAFLFLLLQVFRYSLRVLRRSESAMDRGLALGLIASLAGLTVQSFGVNTFIIVRVMEPFWFLTALVMTSPAIDEERDKALNGDR